MADERTSAMGLWTDAKEYAKAASILLEQPEKIWFKIHQPVCFLLCRGIELVLKSYLRSQGKNLEFLRKAVGHDLEKALKKAEAEGLAKYIQLTCEDRCCIKMYNIYYKKKHFEYRVTGYQNLATSQMLTSLLEKLVNKISIPVNQSLVPLDK